MDDRRAIRVGAIASLVLGVGVLALLTVDVRALRPSLDIEVLLAHPGALEAGADVQIAGRVVGEVVRLELLAARDLEADHPLAGTGGVAARVRLQKRYLPWARRNSEYFISTKGLFGDSYLQIGPPPGDEEMAPPVEAGDRVRGVDPPRMERILVLGFETMQRAQALFTDLEPEVAALRDALLRLDATLDAAEPRPGAYARLDASTDRLSAELARLRALAGEVSLDDLAALARRMDAVAGAIAAEAAALDAELDEVAAVFGRARDRLPPDFGPRLSRAVAQLRGFRERLALTRRQLEDIAALVDRGRGTVGALLHDPEFSDEAKQLGKILKRQPWLLLARPIGGER